MNTWKIILLYFCIQNMKCNNCIHLQPFPKNENEFIQSVSFTVSLSTRKCKITFSKVKMLRLLSYKCRSVIYTLSHMLWGIYSSGQCASHPVIEWVSMSVWYVFCCKYNVHLKYSLKVYITRKATQDLYKKCIKSVV